MSSLSPQWPKKAKPTGSKSSHNCKYKMEWESKRPFLEPSTKKGVSHGAMNDVKNHIKTKKHSVNHKAVVESNKISSHFPASGTMYEKVSVKFILFFLLYFFFKSNKQNIT